jgi:hypothetical protein
MAILFFSYSHKDENLRDRLETHLAGLKREGAIETWHDRRIIAGDEFAGVIDDNINRADIVLLLVSPDFIASDYCFQIEMQRALERHAGGEARVVPVILRPCDWHSAPFGKLMAVPKDGKPVVSWPDHDDALLDIAVGIRQMLRPSATGPVIQARNPAPVQAPLPRTSNLRLKKSFTERDHDRFLEHGFAYMANFFEGSLQELQARNSGIETAFRRVDADRFTAVAYRDGKALSRCKVTLGGSFGRAISFAYNDRVDDASINDSLTVKADDQSLYLHALGMPTSRGTGEGKLSLEGGAEYYWSLFIQALQ